MAKLEKQYSWSEICDLTISRLRSKLTGKEEEKFGKWFMERECLGYCFDYVLVYRAYKIWGSLMDDQDHFIVISGREGGGKSTLAIQLCAWVNPNFNLGNIAYTARGFLGIMEKRAQSFDDTPDETQSVLLDEGTELLSRETMSVTNRILTKTFFVQRALRFLVVICIPNFHMLDSVVRFHRVRTLIEVSPKQRGSYKCIVGSGIKKIAKDGAKDKEVWRINLKSGQFWTGHWNKTFPHTIDHEEYKGYKHKKIQETITELKDSVIEKKMMGLAKVAKQIGCSPNTLKNLIKKGEVEGKLIGSKWYLTRSAYEKLLIT